MPSCTKRDHRRRVSHQKHPKKGTWRATFTRPSPPSHPPSHILRHSTLSLPTTCSTSPSLVRAVPSTLEHQASTISLNPNHPQSISALAAPSPSNFAKHPVEAESSPRRSIRRRPPPHLPGAEEGAFHSKPAESFRQALELDEGSRVRASMSCPQTPVSQHADDGRLCSGARRSTRTSV